MTISRTMWKHKLIIPPGFCPSCAENECQYIVTSTWGKVNNRNVIKGECNKRKGCLQKLNKMKVSFLDEQFRYPQKENWFQCPFFSCYPDEKKTLATHRIRKDSGKVLSNLFQKDS